MRYKYEKVYSVLVDDIDYNDELAIVFAVVDEGNPPDLYVSLERLPFHNSQTNVRETSKMRREIEIERERERESPFWVREVCESEGGGSEAEEMKGG